MTPRTLVDVVEWLEDIFERQQVRRSYGGAIARNFHAMPRLTKDVDVLVLVDRIRLPALFEEFVRGGAAALVVDEDTGHEGVEPLELRRFLGDLQGKHRMTRLLCFGVRVELFFPWHPFDHEVLRRAERHELGARTIAVHTAEDLIVYKMVFGRTKDIEDIKAMVATRGSELDLARIRAGASRLLDEAGQNELETILGDYLS